MAEERKKKWTVRNGDRLSGAVVLILGLYLVYEALKLEFGAITRPGPGFYPTVLAILLVGVSGSIFVRSLWSKDAVLSVSFGTHTGHIGITIAAIVLYAAVLEGIGFLLSTFVLVLLLLVGIGKVVWPRSLLVAAGGTVTFYLVFTKLGIPLPKGILGF